MRAANFSVDRDTGKATPAQAARALEARLGLSINSAHPAG
jgi:hypothetical protein